MEQNNSAKRRERIKTILIIFLALMLVLTFFSNTILNHSLPTVSAQYAGNGLITEKVRGSGIIEANQSYEVTAQGKRKVSKVMVKVGDEVKAGDTLFILDSTDNSEEIQELESTIQDSELAYQKALLTIAPDYAAENQQIADARNALQSAINRLNDARNNQSVSVNTGGVSLEEYQSASLTYKELSSQMTDLSSYLSQVASGELDGVPLEYTASLQDAKNAVDSATFRANSATADIEAISPTITISSTEQRATIRTLERAAETADIAFQRAKEDYEAFQNSGVIPPVEPSETDVEPPMVDGTSLLRAMQDAQQAATYAHEDVDSANLILTGILAQEKSLSDAQNALKQANSDIATAQTNYQNAIKEAQRLIQADIDKISPQLEQAQSTITAYENQSSNGSSDSYTDISSLEEAVQQQQSTLQGLIIALNKTKQEDNITSRGNALDLQSQLNSINRQKEKLEKMKTNAGTQTITSKSNGIVSVVNFSAGEEVTDGSSLATITLTDSGFIVKFSVTSEQAKKVKIGTLAEITNNHYGDISAKLLSSKNDTENPASGNRILIFEITGKDVSNGEMLALSIPCSSQNYDCIVPNSAIREDKNGKFVLVMQSKNTPLGNRYYVTRSNVTVLSSDDTNSAVEGELTTSDFVVTASETPINAGDQVRREENQ
ncbi:MAG: biotin/lipoyl-binding protein [Oscillospiraceae bacterium]